MAYSPKYLAFRSQRCENIKSTAVTFEDIGIILPVLVIGIVVTIITELTNILVIILRALANVHILECGFRIPRYKECM
jgi:hypothetical protein